jgi:hypothetical protein
MAASTTATRWRSAGWLPASRPDRRRRRAGTAPGRPARRRRQVTNGT